MAPRFRPSRSRSTRYLGIVAVALLVITAACGGDDDEGSSGTGGNTFSLFVAGDPSTLTPTHCTDSECKKPLNVLFTGLRDYDVETSEPIDRMLESIESDDNANWTITIEDGWTFHDGTAVTAQSYVDAWNYAAFGDNAQGGASFFARFAGYEDVQCELDDDDQCVAPPTAEVLTGLSAPDDTTIEVELSEPFSQFPLMLGYTVFSPLPDVFFEDPVAFNEEPVGNGPYRMAGPWNHDVAIEVERWDDYPGEDAGSTDGIRFAIYADAGTAYNDLLAGQLDIHESIPPEQLTNAEQDLGDRFFDREISSFTFLGFPTYDERFADPRVRQAMSMAIDRQPIIDAIFNGAFTPAGSVVSPVVLGARDDVCEYCEFDPERAAELLDDAGGWQGPLNLWFNSGAGHDQWVQAIANQLQEHLGITDINFSEEDFSVYLNRGANRGFDGPFRLAWGMDYPSPQNFLEPLFTEAAFGPAGSNFSFYSDPEVEELIASGNAADSIEEGIADYHAAEDIILEDLPVIPLWFGLGFVGHSERVSDVQLDAFDEVDLTAVTVEG